MNTESARVRGSIVFFTIATFLSSACFDFPLFGHPPLSSGPRIFLWLVMWCPGLSALLTHGLFHIPWSALGLGLPRTRFLLLGVWLPILAMSAFILVSWGAGFCGIAPGTLKGRILAVALLFPGKFGRALGEELGWRGFLFPRLRVCLSFRNATLLTGFIWAAWHFPSILQGEYLNAAQLPRALGIACFTAFIAGSTFVYTWLRERSGSVWPAVCLHATFNWFTQSILESILVQKSMTPLAVGEMGLGYVLLGLAVAAGFWNFGKSSIPVCPSESS